MVIFEKIRFSLYTLKKLISRLILKKKYILKEKEEYNIKSGFSNIFQVAIEQNVSVENIYPDIPNIGMKSFRIQYYFLDRCIMFFKDVIIKPNSSFIYFGRDVSRPKIRTG